MRGLIAGMAGTNPGHSLELLADAAPRFPQPAEPGVRFRVLRPLPGGNRMLRAASGGDPWYRVRLGLEGCWSRWDAYVQSAHEPPPAFGVRTRVAIVHDLAFAHDDAPSNFGAPELAELDRWTALNVHSARSIITVSETVAQDVVQTYGVSPDQVIVARHGCDQTRFHSDHAPGDIAACLSRHGLDSPYLLFVGTIQPRKNIPRLVQAVMRARDAGLSDLLIVAGGDGWRSDESLQAMASAGSHAVHYLGRVPASDLPLVMAGARGFVSLATAEGFGMPALEAMATGVPVVVANDAGLAEVVGDAGLPVDPDNLDEVAEALVRVTSDANLRGDLIARGLKRAAGFTWDAAGRSVWHAIEQACASC